jgi:hypothetical protein
MPRVGKGNVFNRQDVGQISDFHSPQVKESFFGDGLFNVFPPPGIRENREARVGPTKRPFSL